MSTPQDEVPFFPGGLVPGARVGRWRVVERLGLGGQGAVYRVEDLDHPGDFYALKLALHARDARAIQHRPRAASGARGQCLWPVPKPRPAIPTSLQGG